MAKLERDQGNREREFRGNTDRSGVIAAELDLEAKPNEWPFPGKVPGPFGEENENSRIVKKQP